MNKELLLEWLRSDAERKAARYDRARRKLKLEEALRQVTNRQDIELPSGLPKEPGAMLRCLAGHFQQKVTPVSLVLNYYFPDQYLFYRVSKLDREIVDGLSYFGEIDKEMVKDFQLPFAAVGETGLERYLKLNDAVQKYARSAWPNPKHRQAAALAFLYDGLGTLFLERSSYNRYWFMVSRPQYWDALDKYRDICWSGRKEMKADDLVFMYRTSPRKAITNLYRVKEAPWFDPWGEWSGFWVDLTSVSSLPDVPFADMRSDPILRQWGPVRRHMEFTLAEAIPHAVYNQLLTRIPIQTREMHGLQSEILGNVGSSGQYGSEREFEEEVVEPLLRRWSFRFEAQHPCLFHLGSQDIHGRVDHFVQDARGPITLFENKLRIASDAERELAIAQGKSYALMLGLPSFVIAAPEELRVYSLRRNTHTEQCYVRGDELAAQEENVRTILMRLRI